MQTIASVAEAATQTAIVTNFITNIAISGSLNALWGMINNLQIIAHYPLINVLMPANSQILFSVIVRVATFDLIPVEGIMDWIQEKFQASPDHIEVGDNWKEFEYYSTDPVHNLGML